VELYICARCKGAFWPDEMSPSGNRRPYYCKSCHNNKQRDWRSNNKERYHKYRKNYYTMNATALRRRSRLYKFINFEKTSAHNKVSYTKLKRQPCEVCGSLDTQAHHDDYSKPLEVRWLCQLHHSRVHKGG